jgi:serine phosphatase RsbU (regulator of sigma subunit)
MRFAWLEHLLPRAVLTPQNQIAWLLFFVLFPLAYTGGVMLETNKESPAMMEGYQDRAASIQTAREFAASKGYPVTGWHEYVLTDTQESLQAWYSANPNDALVASLRRAVPAQQIQVLFRSPDQSHDFRTYLSLTGHVTGYDFGKSTMAGSTNFKINGTTVATSNTTSDDDESSMKNSIRTSDSEAEAIARQAVARNPALSGLMQLGKLDLGKPHISTTEDDSAHHEVSWQASPAGKPELTLKITVGIRDQQVVGERIEATLDKKHKAKIPPFRSTYWSLYSFFLLFGTVYAVVRYARRTLQKEVSHLRTLVVAALFAVSYSTLIYAVGVDQVAGHVSGTIYSKIGLVIDISAATVFSIMGLLVGVAYGSGEGEVREAYPGKLTSLDALLAGRIFSRDVGASLLLGAAAAGWLLLVHQAGSYFLQEDVMATRTDVLTYTFSRLPWLSLLVGRQYDSLLIAVTGLLLPASFLMRRNMRRSRRFAWLILFSTCSVLYDASKSPSFEASILAIAVMVSALLLPFFAFDLLAAMVSLSALSFVEELTRLSAVFPSWNGFAQLLAALACLLLLLAAWLALRGHSVNEEDVRPRYAKNLAQRMSLQAEVQAAREAQLRLLPQDVPELPGIQFAACCLPARGVGGDFYDFFPLDAHRVGIFVAQGGDQGLASALCIALAKGVLMHSSLQPNSPTQTLIDLESSIGELLEGGSAGRISFAYAVMDTRRNLLTYARLGDSPRFVIYREGAVLTPAAQLERVVPVTGRFAGAAPIHEGSVQAHIGDFLIFFTKGIAALRGKRFLRNENQWLSVLIPYLGKREESLQASLTAALSNQKRVSDDLTAVVLRVVQSQPLAQEVVA